MARRSRKDRQSKQKVDPFERVRLKKLRAAERRAERKRRKEAGEETLPRKREAPRENAWHDPLGLEWLHRNGIRMAANKIMNDSYREPAPFWLSVPKHPRPPQADFYPCRSFERGDRIWYGFLFRAHRDEQLERWANPEAHKELTEDARGR